MRLHYLAYGSNLHPLRLQARVPSARLIGTVRLPCRSLTFSKRSVDGSAKCTVGPGTTAQCVFAAVFGIEEKEKCELDLAEGLGVGYQEQWERVKVAGTGTRAFLYVAASDHLAAELQPYHWYKALVLAGARYHDFPAPYISEIERRSSVEDPDRVRRKANDRLLERIGARAGDAGG